MWSKNDRSGMRPPSYNQNIGIIEMGYLLFFFFFSLSIFNSDKAERDWTRRNTAYRRSFPKNIHMICQELGRQTTITNDISKHRNAIKMRKYKYLFDSVLDSISSPTQSNCYFHCFLKRGFWQNSVSVFPSQKGSVHSAF